MYVYTKAHTIERSLLIAPYKTRCINYVKSGQGSNANCFNRCLIAATKHGLPLRVPIWHDGTVDYIAKDFNPISDLKTVERCNDICKADDCQKSIYVLEQTSKAFRHDFVNIRYSDYSTKIETIAKLTFMLFMIYLASVVSFWYGFSLLSTKDISLRNHSLLCHDD